MPELVLLKMSQILRAIAIFGLSPSILGVFLMGPALAFYKLAFEKPMIFLESRENFPL